MFLTASLTGENAVIFPEILALLIGLVCADRLPWKTDTIHTLLLMTLCAIAGCVIVRYVPFIMYFKALIGLSFAAVLITITDCMLMPCLSAVLLPIYLNDGSVLYPCAVFVMVGAVLLIRSLLIHSGMKEAAIKFHYTPNFEYDLKIWLKILIAFALMALTPMLLRDLPLEAPIDAVRGIPELIFIIAPPLVVTMSEAFFRDMRGRRFRVWFIMTIAAVTGALMRFIGVELLDITPAVPAVIAAMITVLEMKLMNIYFPPAGAAVLLAFLVEGNVFLYPPMIAAGCLLVLIAASIFGVKRNY